MNALKLEVPHVLVCVFPVMKVTMSLEHIFIFLIAWLLRVAMFDMEAISLDSPQEYLWFQVTWRAPTGISLNGNLYIFKDFL